MDEIYEIAYGRVDAPLFVPVSAIGKLIMGQIFKVPNLYAIQNLQNNFSFKVIQVSVPEVVNDRLVTKINAELIKNKPEEEKSKICYICGIDLMESYKTDMRKQDGLNAPPVIPQMTKWNGVKEIVCPDCYKAVESGVSVYMANNPTWKRPVSKS